MTQKCLQAVGLGAVGFKESDVDGATAGGAADVKEATDVNPDVVTQVTQDFERRPSTSEICFFRKYQKVFL